MKKSNALCFNILLKKLTDYSSLQLSCRNLVQISDEMVKKRDFLKIIDLYLSVQNKFTRNGVFIRTWTKNKAELAKLATFVSRIFTAILEEFRCHTVDQICQKCKETSN